MHIVLMVLQAQPHESSRIICDFALAVA